MVMPIYYNICAAFEGLTIFTIDYYTNVIHNLIAKENPGSRWLDWWPTLWGHLSVAQVSGSQIDIWFKPLMAKS